MFRFFSSLFLLVSLLGASTNQDILKRAEGLAGSGKTNELFRAYNDYKNLYLRSIISGDSSLKIKSLNGIVVTGKELHIDVSQYSDELKKINSHNTYKVSKSDTRSKTKTVKLEPLSRVKSVKWDGNDLVLSFDTVLKNGQIKYFVLHDSKKNRYRYVFDISSSSISKSKVLVKKGVSRIKLNQYNPKTLRLVFENREKLNLHFTVDKNDLIISLLITEKQVFNKSTLRTLPKKYNTHTNKIIVVDPGHGGKDSGAIGYRHYYEKNLVLSIAKELTQTLKKRGYKVYMTRDRDIFIKLKERTAYANRKDADLFISIHANAVCSSKAEKACGIETYFLSPSRSARATSVAELENSADLSDMNGYGKTTFLKFTTNLNRIASNKLAIDLQRGMLGNLRKHHKGVIDAGVREGPFWVLVGAQMPAVLVEVGFITNPEEAKKLVNKTYEKHLAEGIANGVESYFINN
ncbi:N-acetylmuramoyl-L-alanine amidase [Sulfurimonas sp. HSL-1716]|uniref:N-acetylmuramoyl-L-alanine amidase family protein n=1 Tax=Hydrocurvibacter sulfurireducens TaxID=3131937 RepID=UPI0031F9D0FB